MNSKQKGRSQFASTAPPVSHGQHLLGGSFRVFLAEALFPVTGIVTAAFLTRKLGASDYGLFTLSATVIVWIQVTITSLFARATIKLIGDSGDWRLLAARVVQLHVTLGVVLMITLWLLASPLAGLLHEPKMAHYLRLFAIDIPLATIANCHGTILVGRGGYHLRARIRASRWLSRLLLIVLLVGLGFSVEGAIVASIGASVIELFVARLYVRPALIGPRQAAHGLWGYALPVFLSALFLRLLGIDIFVLKALGASAAQAGFYGAAQNITFVSAGVLGASVAPLLLSSLSTVLRERDLPTARTLGRNAIRCMLVVIPLCAIISGAAGEIVVLLFGEHFGEASTVFSVLIFAASGVLIIQVSSAIMVAAGKPGWTVFLAAPMVPAAFAGLFLMVPRFGSVGAALVTTTIDAAGALAGLYAVYRLLRIRPPLATFLRAILIAIPAYLVASFWSTSGLLLLAKLPIISAGVFGAFLLTGELKGEELSSLRVALKQFFQGGERHPRE